MFKRSKKRRGWIATILLWAVGLVAAFYVLCLLELVALRWIDPPTTTVQAQRRFAAWLHHKPYRERYVFVPLNRISLDLQHAVIAAEDSSTL